MVGLEIRPAGHTLTFPKYYMSYSEKRLTQDAEDIFFTIVDLGPVSIINVFTQFDALVDKHRRKL
jgi:hypothetical protein